MLDPALPPGQTLGKTDGSVAVFHVAVVGYAVVAIVGTVVPYGVGPGTEEDDVCELSDII